MIATLRAKNLLEAKKIVPPKGFEKINVLSWHPKDTKYYELSPYYLKTDGQGSIVMPAGIIFENAWQSSKIYETVYDIEVYPSIFQQNNPRYLWWKYTCANGTGKEIHWNSETNLLTPEYYNWRNSLWNCPNPVRYPNGKERIKETLFGMIYVRNGMVCSEFRFDYLTGRRNFYCAEYVRLVQNIPCYHELVEKLKNRKKLLIVEIDVPAPGKKGLYGELADDDGYFIANLENLNSLLNDPSEPFGHGLCLAMALLSEIRISDGMKEEMLRKICYHEGIF